MKGKYPNNLRKVMEAAGVRAAELARSADTAPQNIQRLADGERKLTREWAEKLAPFIPGAAPADLIFAAEVKAAGAAVVGLIGADARADVVVFGEAGEGAAYDYSAPLPPNFKEGVVALEVRGESMRNVARDGWLVYYDSDDIREPPTEDLYGDLCICWLEDGRTLLKELQPGMGDGFFDLESTNAPTIRDVVVARAARVTSIVPRGRRPNTDQFKQEHQAPPRRNGTSG